MFFHPFQHRLQGTRPRMGTMLLICGLLCLLGGSLALSTVFTKVFPARAAPTTSAPVSKSWYFAEGRVGAGFKEYLTLSNPDPSTDCSATISYLPEGTVYTSQVRKPLLVENVVVPHASLYTTSVNHDLHLDQMQNPGALFSALVTVPSSSRCPGLVVERPMYFSFHGVTSGSDVVGAIDPTLTNSFADIPVGTGISTFLSILNPSNSTPVAITATYYAAGAVVGTQTLSVAANARGTLTASDPSLHLPAHASVVVTSDQPVVEGQVGKITTAGVITEYSVNDTHSADLGDELNYITTGLDGNLWFGEFYNNAVARITSAGVVTTFTAGISASAGPYDIVTGPDNNLWFTEENSTSKIGIITSTGTVVTEVDLGVNADPGAIIMGADHNVWFSDYSTGKIGKCVVTYS